MHVVPAAVLCVPLTSLLFLLIGCSSSPSASTPPPATSTPDNSLKVSGSVHHGQIPISGAHVFVAVLACIIPAWRAPRLDPVQTVRSE
jgi:hypothetical protein